MQQLTMFPSYTGRRKKIAIALVCIIIAAGIVFVTGRIVRNRRMMLIAEVNGYPVTVEEVAAKYGSSPDFYRRYVRENPDAVVQDYVNQVLLFQRASRYEKRYRKKLRRLVDLYYREMLVREFLEDEVMKSAVISDDEVERYYNAHLNEFVIPERVRLYEIVVSTREEGDNILNRLMLGERFEDIARNESVSSSRDSSGDLGWVEVADVHPELEEIVFTMEPGQIYGRIIKTGMGYHIIKVGSRQSKKIQTLEEATPYIRGILYAQKKKETVEELIEKLREESDIVVHEKNLGVLQEKVAGGDRR